MTPLPTWITMDDLAELLGVSKRSIANWLREGRIPEPIRFGARTTRWRKTDAAILWIITYGPQPPWTYRAEPTTIEKVVAADTATRKAVAEVIEATPEEPVMRAKKSKPKLPTDMKKPTKTTAAKKPTQVVPVELPPEVTMGPPEDAIQPQDANVEPKKSRKKK